LLVDERERRHGELVYTTPFKDESTAGLSLSPIVVRLLFWVFFRSDPNEDF